MKRYKLHFQNKRFYHVIISPFNDYRFISGGLILDFKPKEYLSPYYHNSIDGLSVKDFFDMYIAYEMVSDNTCAFRNKYLIVEESHFFAKIGL